jgi:hypothetical protein
MTNVYKKALLTGGQFQDASGNALSLGYLVFKLSSDSNVAVLGGPTGLQIVSGSTVKIFLDTNGNIQSGQSIWTNDILSPSGSFYQVRAFNSSGLEVWTAPQYFTLLYQPSINLGTYQPT